MLILSICLLASGCGGDDALGRRAISGKVTLDGAPLDSGTIHFEPLGGSTSHGTGTVIRDGQYEVAADHGLPPGSYKVSISALEQIKQAPVMGQELPPPAERIPAKYNVNTELVVEVTESGLTTFDFQLESAKR